ncbi:DUF5642 family protein [Amycolatopsis sp., V23-08]|uniref:DUF5642 family protein n=1 Tax=Amycolatopsis heterodermiae TaxID=3110235 RepID=A0ABU5RLC7_9PSEU|nr:DUF5642 family protein [Amycolatopsis sp., V23-08]MEA5367077.1 DUF5642 family protein [Amycolatopsis sp., V23-08]
MTARIRRPSRFPPVRAAALLVSAAAAVTISGTAEKPETSPPVSFPLAVSPAVLLPPPAVPDAPRDTFDVATALSTADRSEDGTGCADVTHGRLLRPGDAAAGQGFQSAAAGGQVSELVARTVRPVDLPAWAERARQCGRITVDDPQGTAVSSITVRPGPAVPDAETLSYEQVLTLPGQPAELPGLRLRTVAIAADDVLVVLRDAGATDLDLDTLAVAAWQHAAPRLGR